MVFVTHAAARQGLPELPRRDNVILVGSAADTSVLGTRRKLADSIGAARAIFLGPSGIGECFNQATRLGQVVLVLATPGSTTARAQADDLAAQHPGRDAVVLNASDHTQRLRTALDFETIVWQQVVVHATELNDETRVAHAEYASTTILVVPSNTERLSEARNTLDELRRHPDTAVVIAIEPPTARCSTPASISQVEDALQLSVVLPPQQSATLDSR